MMMYFMFSHGGCQRTSVRSRIRPSKDIHQKGAMKSRDSDEVSGWIAGRCDIEAKLLGR